MVCPTSGVDVCPLVSMPGAHNIAAMSRDAARTSARATSKRVAYTEHRRELLEDSAICPGSGDRVKVGWEGCEIVLKIAADGDVIRHTILHSHAEGNQPRPLIGVHEVGNLRRGLRNRLG